MTTPEIGSKAAHSKFDDRLAWSAVVVRSLIVLSPLAAIGATWLAAHRTVPAVTAPVLLLSIACAARPASHLGLPVVAGIAIQWIAIVHDHTTPWSIAAAAALAVFHVAQAAATVAPPTATWTPAMRVRWIRRSSILIIASAFTWACVELLNSHTPAASTALLTTALLTLAATGLWASHSSGRPDQTN